MFVWEILSSASPVLLDCINKSPLRPFIPPNMSEKHKILPQGTFGPEYVAVFWYIGISYTLVFLHGFAGISRGSVHHIDLRGLNSGCQSCKFFRD